MDPDRFKEAYARLQALDDGHTYRVRPKRENNVPTVEQLNERLRDTQNYLIEVKEILGELFLAIGTSKKT